MIVPKFIIFFKNYFLERVKLTNEQADERTSGRTDERMDGGKATSAIALSLRRFVISSLCRFVVWVLWVLKGSKGFYGAILAGRALNSKSPTPSNSQDTLRDYLYNKRTNRRADEQTSGRTDERMDGGGGKATSAIVLSLCRLGSVGSKGFYGAILAGRALNSKSPTPSNSLNPLNPLAPSDSLTPLTPSKDNKQKSARPKPSAFDISIYQFFS